MATRISGNSNARKLADKKEVEKAQFKPAAFKPAAFKPAAFKPVDRHPDGFTPATRPAKDKPALGFSYRKDGSGQA